MEAESYSEIPTPVYSNTRHYIPKDSTSLELQVRLKMEYRMIFDINLSTLK